MPARPHQEHIEIIRVGMTDALEGHGDLARVARQTGDRDFRRIKRASAEGWNADERRVGRVADWADALHNRVDRGRGQRAAGVVHCAGGQGVAARSNACPAERIRRARVFAEEGGPVVELDLGDGVAVGRYAGRKVDRCGRGEGRAVGRRAQRDSWQRVGHGDVGRRGIDRAAGVVNGAGRQGVAARSSTRPGERIRRSRVFTEEGRAIVELDLRDRVAVGGHAGRKVDRCRRGEGRAVGRRGQRDDRIRCRRESELETPAAGDAAAVASRVVQDIQRPGAIRVQPIEG